MKIPLACCECSRERGQAADGTWPAVFFLADLEDDGTYIGQCVEGHNLAVVLDHAKYEVLFQSAALAYICGFHREAVSSAATALERFFELACHVLWDHLGVTGMVRDDAWKRMAAQSERQIGALLALYPVVLSESFPWQMHQMQQRTEFRNKVVHRGIIPTRTETEAYLQAIYEIIEETTDRLIKTCSGAFTRVRVHRVSNSQDAARKLTDVPVGAAVLGDVILSRIDVSAPRDFPRRLQRLRESLSLYFHVPW